MFHGTPSPNLKRWSTKVFHGRKHHDLMFYAVQNYTFGITVYIVYVKHKGMQTRIVYTKPTSHEGESNRNKALRPVTLFSGIYSFHQVRKVTTYCKPSARPSNKTRSKTTWGFLYWGANWQQINMSTTPMLSSPTSVTTVDQVFSVAEKEDNERVRMKKQLGLLEGVAIILGIIFGSGIFVSPKGVIKEVGSVGFSIVVWVLCGLLSMIGALCYAELGTSIPKSGGDYAYIFEAFGALPAFLYLWDAMLIFVPTTNAIMGLTFASYVIQPFFPSCDLPDNAVRMLAAATICFLTFMNCYDVKLTTRMQNLFMFTKITALMIIVIAGLTYLGLGNTQNMKDPFQGTVTDPGKIAVSFYSGIFSYSGWNYLNFMTEELKNPYVNLPRAIYISLPLVTLIYVLANVAYLAVLSPTAMIASKAIAVTFGDHVLGVMSWVMPVMVALSAFGGLSVHIMTSSRMCFVGARYGHFPAMLSHINIKRFTPTPSLVFLNALSLVMLCTSDVYVLINYSSFVESVFITLSVAGILWLRWKQPDMVRPIKVSKWIPIVFVVICLFLVIIPCYTVPYEVGMGVLITLTGVPAYFAGVVWQQKPEWFQRWFYKLTCNVQKLFLSAKEE